MHLASPNRNKGRAELNDEDHLLVRYHAKKVEPVKCRYTRQEYHLAQMYFRQGNFEWSVSSFDDQGSVYNYGHHLGLMATCNVFMNV